MPRHVAAVPEDGRFRRPMAGGAAVGRDRPAPWADSHSRCSSSVSVNRAKAFTLGENCVSSFTGMRAGSPSAPFARHCARRSMKAASIRSGQAGVQSAAPGAGGDPGERLWACPARRAGRRACRRRPRRGRPPRRLRHRASSGRPDGIPRRRCRALAGGRIRPGYVPARFIGRRVHGDALISMQTSVVVNARRRRRCWRAASPGLEGGAAELVEAVVVPHVGQPGGDLQQMREACLLPARRVQTGPGIPAPGPACCRRRRRCPGR